MALNGKVYIIGGFDGVNCHPSMETYVPERDEWIVEPQNMHYNRSGVKTVQINGVIVAAGGFDGRRR